MTQVRNSIALWVGVVHVRSARKGAAIFNSKHIFLYREWAWTLPKVYILHREMHVNKKQPSKQGSMESDESLTRAAQNIN